MGNSHPTRADRAGRAGRGPQGVAGRRPAAVRGGWAAGAGLGPADFRHGATARRIGVRGANDPSPTAHHPAWFGRGRTGMSVTGRAPQRPVVWRPNATDPTAVVNTGRSGLSLQERRSAPPRPPRRALGLDPRPPHLGVPGDASIVGRRRSPVPPPARPRRTPGPASWTRGRPRGRGLRAGRHGPAVPSSPCVRWTRGA